MELKPGMLVSLNVERETNFGYFLTSENEDIDDILLHKRQVKGTIKIGQDLEVFLFHDHQGRLSATMEKPIISLGVGEFAWLKVVAVNERDGVFLYNGIDRDLFLSMDDLGIDRDLWPRVGEKVPVSLIFDKKGRLMGRLLRGSPIEETAAHAPKTILNETVTGTIYSFAEKGVFVMTEDDYVAFLHFDETNDELHLGKVITGRVSFVRDDGKLNISMQPKAYERQQDDAEEIYQFLLKQEAGMPYTDKSDPILIKQKFGMSKGSFKRALGKLLKEGKVHQKDGWTFKKE
ncbi:S1-like domain-containing RNA-binding protein [Bacillaceae bacterium IKA-2]|nr:S1-like domain-containing RNA-binding protein [Bacillaceae bacterium IKA-2]